MSDRTLTAAQFLEQYEAKPPTEDEPYELEVMYLGHDWSRLIKVCTDVNDQAKPVFVDTEAGRLTLEGHDELRVRDVLSTRPVSR